MQKYEADNRHSHINLIEQSLDFPAVIHYAVETWLKQTVDQSGFEKKTLNDWNTMSLKT